MTNICQECGMVCRTPTEYHPYAACLMFKACHDGDKVRANLEAVRADAPEAGQGAAAVQAVGAPAGWKLVPIEATEAMKAAAVIYANGNAVYKNVKAEVLRIEEGIYGEVFEAMLAAAPVGAESDWLKCDACGQDMRGHDRMGHCTPPALAAAPQAGEPEEIWPVAETEGASEALARLVHDVRDLMDNSEGVAGLHQNGDLAPWSDLEESGRYSSWLGDALGQAEAVLATPSPALAQPQPGTTQGDA